jgi:hypothetical protein
MPKRIRLLVALFTLLVSSGCEHFAPYEAVPEATGPIPEGMARVRIENGGSYTILETWYSSCLGGNGILKVPRTIRPGESTQQDVTAGCVRVMMYPRTGVLQATVTAPAGEVTVVAL